MFGKRIIRRSVHLLVIWLCRFALTWWAPVHNLFTCGRRIEPHHAAGSALEKCPRHRWYGQYVLAPGLFCVQYILSRIGMRKTHHGHRRYSNFNMGCIVLFFNGTTLVVEPLMVTVVVKISHFIWWFWVLVFGLGFAHLTRNNNMYLSSCWIFQMLVCAYQKLIVVPIGHCDPIIKGL